MIEAFTGAPGSGKSLDMARIIKQKISLGKRVICNTEINLPEKLKKYECNLFFVENKDITPKYLREFAERYHESRKEKQTIVVIDECQLKFSQAFMTKDKSRLWLELFSQHRKLGFDFLLVTPSSRYGIVREIRENMEQETMHFKLSNYPTKSIFLSILFLLIAISPIEIFMRVTSWVGLPSKQYLVRHLFLYSPKYAKMYDTYKIQDSSDKKPQPIMPDAVSDVGLLNPPEP